MPRPGLPLSIGRPPSSVASTRRATTHSTATASMPSLPHSRRYDVPTSAQERRRRRPLEPQACPGDEEVLLEVHGVLLAAASEHDIRPNGFRLLAADRCAPSHRLALRIVPVLFGPLEVHCDLLAAASDRTLPGVRSRARSGGGRCRTSRPSRASTKTRAIHSAWSTRGWQCTSSVWIIGQRNPEAPRTPGPRLGTRTSTYPDNGCRLILKPLVTSSLNVGRMDVPYGSIRGQRSIHIRTVP